MLLVECTRRLPLNRCGLSVVGLPHVRFACGPVSSSQRRRCPQGLLMGWLRFTRGRPPERFALGPVSSWQRRRCPRRKALVQPAGDHSQHISPIRITCPVASVGSAWHAMETPPVPPRPAWHGGRLPGMPGKRPADPDCRPPDDHATESGTAVTAACETRPQAQLEPRPRSRVASTLRRR